MSDPKSSVDKVGDLGRRISGMSTISKLTDSARTPTATAAQAGELGRKISGMSTVGKLNESAAKGPPPTAKPINPYGKAPKLSDDQKLKRLGKAFSPVLQAVGGAARAVEGVAPKGVSSAVRDTASKMLSSKDPKRDPWNSQYRPPGEPTALERAGFNASNRDGKAFSPVLQAVGGAARAVEGVAPKGVSSAVRDTASKMLSSKDPKRDPWNSQYRPPGEPTALERAGFNASNRTGSATQDRALAPYERALSSDTKPKSFSDSLSNTTAGKMTKTSGDGMFHKSANHSARGNFFKDTPGRDDGRFYEKIANNLVGYPEEGMVDAGGAGSAGEEMGGGMYGTGEPTSRRPTIKSILNVAGPGKTRPAIKVAGAAPSDWNADDGLSTGFHRPTRAQPEGLEFGGDRFHSTLAKPPSAGSTTGTRHGVIEGGSLALPVSATHNLGKHAGVDEMLTSDYWRARGEEAKKSLSSGGRDFGETADKAIKTITNSPGGTAIAGLIGLKMLGRGGRGLARGAGRLFGHKQPPPPSLLGSVAGGLRRLVGGK